MRLSPRVSRRILELSDGLKASCVALRFLAFVVCS
jgi:hypothetical protein